MLGSNTLHVWDLDAREIVTTIEVDYYSSWLQGGPVQLSDDQRTLFIYNDDPAEVVGYDADTGEQVFRYTLPTGTHGYVLAAEPGKVLLASEGWTGVIDPVGQTLLWELEGPTFYGVGNGVLYQRNGMASYADARTAQELGSNPFWEVTPLS